jgi:Carboxypeptidase regulatory-like domain
LHSFAFSSSRRTKPFTLILFLFLIIPAFVHGQTFRGAISGSVTDQTGAVLSGASVRAENQDTGLVRELTTGSNGDFALQDLPLGKYTVTVSQTGFQTVRVENLNVAVGAVTALR